MEKGRWGLTNILQALWWVLMFGVGAYCLLYLLWEIAAFKFGFAAVPLLFPAFKLLRSGSPGFHSVNS